ncbi:hypothetical protein [Aeromonas caviae]|uniref:hypothetical protein n=1 Tax=Aeromonas caviae TaxID=648 RepID=UPI001FB98060|nr:hypothetical protein [Aeromonas caviae]GKR23692.1 hypothetical protein KAM468_24320 [Aeromonas caviae]GKR27929.1 hypothetical protein KAM469_23880 [Aeromonas caviae]GKR32338.1 hypothetical protein KAM470_24110 [Aeromonas caviae]GKR61760.1 hypothetical protein KAM477_23820 [Aeromonas caviae]GKR66210.1 hypothetical protein KAM478_24670 [Aeromonas caviae]
MKIISHRGYWKTADEKNQSVAFSRSFSLGFGTETDVRDACGHLVISHDMPRGDELPFADMLDCADYHATGGAPLTLALNIKADGLASVVAKEIAKRPHLDCFVFDMAVPDMRAYLDAGIPVFTRISEVEPMPAWLNESAGIWLDAFRSPWYSVAQIAGWLKTHRVCIVSNELHRREHLSHWEMLKPLTPHDNLILCTDLPEDAAAFFGNQGD